MAQPSSPHAAQAETRAHQPQRMPTGCASSPLATGAPPSSSSLTTLSSVGQRHAQAPRRSPFLLSGPHASSSSNASRASPRSPQPWTQSDDAFLIASYKQHGRKWLTIAKAFEGAGRIKRSLSSMASRLRILQTHAARQRQTQQHASSAVSSSSVVPQQPQTQEQDEFAALLAASSALHARTMGSDFTPSWSPKEIQKLSEIPVNKGWTKSVFKVFCDAFPLTTRTESAVTTKWHRIHRHGKTRGLGKDTDEDENEGRGVEENHEAAFEGKKIGGPEEAESRSAPHAAAPASTSLLNAQQLQKKQSYFTKTTRAPADAWSAPSTVDGEEDGENVGLPSIGTSGSPSSAAAAMTQRLARQASSTPSWSRRLPINYSIDLQPNGFFITNLPPGHQLRVLTPTQCQVLVPAQLPTRSHNEEPQPQQQQQQDLLPETPFSFEVRVDGTIEALSLPQGTTSSVEVIEMEDGQLRQRQAFCGVDGYLVVFENVVS